MRLGKLLLIFLLMVTVGQFGVSMIGRLRAGVSQDFEVFYQSGRQVLAGKNPYEKIGGDIIRNPPPAMLFFAGLGLWEMNASEVIYAVISFLVFWWGWVILLRLLSEFGGKMGKFSIWEKIIGAILVFCFFPWRHNLASGQVNNFVFLLMVLSFNGFLKKESWFSAAAMAGAIFLKITPVFLMLAFLIKGGRLVVLETLVFLAAGGGLATLILGSEVWGQYQAAAGSFLDLRIGRYYNQALTGWLNRLAIGAVEWFYLAALLAAGGVFLYLWRNYKKSFEQDLILWNMSIVTMLLLAPFAWQYHLVITIFPLMTTYYLIKKLRREKWFYGFWFLVCLLLAVNIKNPIAFEGQGVWGATVLSHGTMGLVGLMILQGWLEREYSND